MIPQMYNVFRNKETSTSGGINLSVKNAGLASVVMVIMAALLFLQVQTVHAEENIQISKAEFVTEAKGFGIYEKEEDNHFLSGSTTGVYLEIDNFSVRQGEEKFVTDIHVRLDVLNEENKVVYTSDDVFKMQNELKSRRRDLSFRIPLDFSGWKTGKYTLNFTVFDKIRQQTNSKNLALQIF